MALGRKSGLFCRWDHWQDGVRGETRCVEVFIPMADTVTLIQLAAAERNAHEVVVHDYHHKVIETTKPIFQKPNSRPLDRTKVL